jgi:cytochrome c oxidase cbb3-type subunit 3
MSSFFNWWVIILTLGNIFACLWLIWWSTKRRPGEAATGEVTGHTWDGDLEEYNNPLPRWWLYMFYLTIVFGLGYLVLYPGLGNFKGVLDWSEVGQYNQEMKQAEAKYAPIYEAYGKTPIPQLAGDAKAMATARRIFLANCATCHGSDAGGAPGRGFPSLNDSSWLYGGSPATLVETITKGRQGAMPSMAAAIGGPQGVKEVANYVRSLSGLPHDAALAKQGEPKFKTVCAACHGANGKGSAANGIAGIGAPNLTDSFWLFGGSLAAIEQTITKGRSGMMPAWGDRLGADKVHLMAAYVYSLSK